MTSSVVTSLKFVYAQGTVVPKLSRDWSSSKPSRVKTALQSVFRQNDLDCEINSHLISNRIAFTNYLTIT